MKILTPDEYVVNKIQSYPTLVLSETYETSKLKVFNQLFNVIGNGVRDDEELLEQISGEPMVLSEKAFKETYWYGYDIDLTEKHCIELVTDCYESDKLNYPKVSDWIELKIYPFNPYPNFQVEYSTVYQCPIFLTLGEEWIRAALHFYKHCKEWFKTNWQYYHLAYPQMGENGNDKSKFQQKDMMEWLEKYSTHEEVTEAYGVEYDGDVDKFMKKRWEKELNRINDYIDSTIRMLENV
jgi:hypothetical protein